MVKEERLLRARADRLLSSSGYEQAFLSRTKLGRTKNVSFNKVEEIWGGEQVSQGSVERREIERETNILRLKTSEENYSRILENI